VLDARDRRLRAALAAMLVRDNAPELRLVREWLNSWSGLGLIIAGVTHQGWDVQLTAYAARDWRANFFPVGIAHSIVGGTAWPRGGGVAGSALAQQNFKRDDYECIRETSQRGAGGAGLGGALAITASNKESQRLYIMCMELRGWTQMDEGVKGGWRPL
jgi:hypothetical protein